MPIDHEDRQLIIDAQRDVQLFEHLYNKYIDKMYQFFYYRTGKNAQIAEDLTADLFMRALQHLPKFTWQGYPYSAYLYQIARSLCADFYRKHERPSIDIADIEIHDPKSDGIATHVDIDFLWQEIAKFSPALQELFELRYIEDLSYDEIALIVGKKSGAIRTAISRAIDQLQHTYETHH